MTVWLLTGYIVECIEKNRWFQEKNRRLRRGSNFPISYYFPSLLPRIFIISPSSIPILTSFIPFSLWGDFFLLPSTLENTSLMRSPASKYGVHIKTDRITSGFRKYGVLLIIMGFTQNDTQRN